MSAGVFALHIPFQSHPFNGPPATPTAQRRTRNRTVADGDTGTQLERVHGPAVRHAARPRHAPAMRRSMVILRTARDANATSSYDIDYANGDSHADTSVRSMTFNTRKILGLEGRRVALHRHTLEGLSDLCDRWRENVWG